MSVTTPDIYQFASSLLERAEDEVQLRTVVSRLYYACYHECKELANDLTLPMVREDGVGMHLALIKALRNARIGDYAQQHMLRELSETLFDLREARTKADYYIGEAVVREEADIALGTADDIYSSIRRFRSQNQVGGAMQN